MGFQKFSVALAVMILMIILPLKPDCGRAAVLVMKINTTYHCNGLLNGCIIGEDLESELDFFMGSNVIRILEGGKKPVTGSSKNPRQHPCPGTSGVPYGNCIPLTPNNGNKKPPCKPGSSKAYNRNCPH